LPSDKHNNLNWRNIHLTNWTLFTSMDSISCECHDEMGHNIPLTISGIVITLNDAEDGEVQGKVSSIERNVVVFQAMLFYSDLNISI